MAGSIGVLPVLAFLAFMLLESHANPWTPIAFVLVVLLVLHVPLFAWTRKRVVAAGSSFTSRGKLRVILPPSINALLLLAIVIYLGVICSWRFACSPT